MTPLGNYLKDRSVNKSEISRKTGLSKARLSQLCINDTTNLRVDELCLIANAIQADPSEMFLFICSKING